MAPNLSHRESGEGEWRTASMQGSQAHRRWSYDLDAANGAEPDPAWEWLIALMQGLQAYRRWTQDYDAANDAKPEPT